MSVAKKFSSFKPQKLTKLHDITRLTFSKLTLGLLTCASEDKLKLFYDSLLS